MSVIIIHNAAQNLSVFLRFIVIFDNYTYSILTDAGAH